ncbi:MAG: hypothetical protein ICV87_02280 [Gemmatimonadetes bacterium]|nr:hypothetical protein [Gemmatimonadota bacterium]
MKLPSRSGALLLSLALAACGDDPTRGEPAGPAVSLERVRVSFLACTDPCGVRLTYRARRADTQEPVATTLRLSGDGFFRPEVSTRLPEGEVTITWEYPLPKEGSATYNLRICPEVGACATNTATIGAE